MTNYLVSDTDQLFRGIGRVVVEFQQIEHGLADVLASLLQMKHDSDTYRVTAAMSYGQKINLMCDLYPSRRNSHWPTVDVQITRNSLKAAEEFRNTVVHSLWHVGGAEPQWLRTKANLRSKGQLKISTGKANLDALREGSEHLYTIKDWYVGRSDDLALATSRLKSLTQELSIAG